MHGIYKDYKTYSSITLTCFSMLALAACGSSAIDSESQDSALDGEPSSTQPAGAGSDDPGGPAQPGGELGQPAACVQAFAQDTPGKVCNVTHGGLCFESNDVACACAGCPLDGNGASSSCLINESFPAQAYCARATVPNSSSDIDPDCPVSDSDSETDSDSNDCDDADLPATGDISAGAGTIGSDGSGASCAGGFAADSTQGVCNATYGGLCFESDAAACACAGCPIDSPAGCQIAESYPTQVSCP